jgi:cobalt-zinc-cadmium efflux system outer membrane protein
MRQVLFLCTLLSGIALAQKNVAPTPVVDLLNEAREHSPSILAANAAIRTRSFGPAQARAFPDTEVMVQSLSVGDPRPLAGFRTSDFAYLGFGASQELPYPGKRALRGKVAETEIGVSRAEAGMTLADVLERVKVAYFTLARTQAVLALLERNRQAVDDIEQAVQIRYRVGSGTQQDVLRAQLEHTRLLNEIALQQRDAGQMQALLRALLNRPADAPEIVAGPLAPRLMADLESQVTHLLEQNPELQLRHAEVEKASAEVQLVAREKKPDFGAQYMWQHTSDRFRDYYMATFSVRLPNRGRVNAAVSQAEARRQQVEAQRNAQAKQLEGEVAEQLAALRTTEEQLKIYREGLLPQSDAAFNAGMAGYRAGKQDYQPLLASYSDTLRLAIEYQQLAADHEMGLAHLERLLGGELK